MARGVEPSEAVAKLAAVEVSSECGMYGPLATCELSSEVGMSAPWPSTTANLSLVVGRFGGGFSDAAACARGNSEPVGLLSVKHCCRPVSPSSKPREANINGRLKSNDTLTHIARSDAPPFSCSLALADAKDGRPRSSHNPSHGLGGLPNAVKVAGLRGAST